jgi:Ankyrin repeats (3 copies)
MAPRERGNMQTALKKYFFLVSGDPDVMRMFDEPFRPDRLMIGLNDLIGRKDLDTINNILLSDSQQVLSTLHPSCYDAALLCAAFTSNVPMVKMLLEMGANPLVSDTYSQNVLYYAACSPAVAAGECCTLLHQHGALVNCWDKEGRATPLICAAGLGNIHSMTALLAAGASVIAGFGELNRPDACTALLWAVRARSPACVEILIEHGAPVNSPRAYRYLNI